MARTKPDVPPGCVTIRAPFTDDAVTFLLDETAPKLSGGYGGYQSIAIPRKRAVRFYSDRPEDGLEIQVVVLPGTDTVARQIRNLEAIGQATEDRRSRQVELFGQLPPLPIDRWVIDDVTWGDCLYTASGRTLIEARLTITFGEPPNVDALTVKKGGRSKYRDRHGKRAKHPTAALLAGETLQEFCARTLGDPSRWKEVAKLQKPDIKDPRHPNRVGKRTVKNRRLKLPSR